MSIMAQTTGDQESIRRATQKLLEQWPKWYLETLFFYFNDHIILNDDIIAEFSYIEIKNESSNLKSSY